MDIDSMAPGEGCQFSGFDAIKGMYTRGAPAIMLVGCFSVVVELDRAINKGEAELLGYNLENRAMFEHRFMERLKSLVESRPTAVNLANGCEKIRSIVNAEKLNDLSSLFNCILTFSSNLYKDDLQANLSIGKNGVKYIYDELESENFHGDFAVMTICNTGSLATSGHGTALGIVRSLHERARLDAGNGAFQMSHVYACETRPYNQGSRLSAYELKYEKIPFTLITDSMASFLVETLCSQGKATSRGLRDPAPVKFIIVGADRIVKNGDLANKIGTFQLSLIASLYPSVNFIAAAPTTTIDNSHSIGDEIVIEQRPERELCEVRGGEIEKASGDFAIDPTTDHVKLTKVRIAPRGIHVWNPSFDVTPHKNIDCIVTELGYILKDSSGEFHM
ncbi:hypothetical protein FOA43_003294 [Brettanomyces nanus]|uniref:S-methyl-5-thioribose-1-phosphate isomerase n=1 Tax=Eeniella nana TaxID=13502 RepID=A0A875S4N2_EENNA|nr:uncharacterized protein FOA43_003294 [Brettanomyces nanus]QPG75908.1 hypothetical protein FOA43_003294 [Brettanomyces nanus]